MNDPIVEEVRKVRDEHAQRFNYDLAAICADIRCHQSHCGHRVIRLNRDANKSLAPNRDFAAASSR